MTIRAVARAMGVDWMTANRLLKPLPALKSTIQRDQTADRDAWEAHAIGHPDFGIKALRSVEPALYARLYRNDRTWIRTWSSRRKRQHNSKRRIDWAARDQQLEELVRAAVALTLKMEPPRCASRTYILGFLRLGGTLAHYAALVPRTATALEEQCESVFDFQLRRLTYVLKQKEMERAPAWVVLRAAGIATSRFPDDGLSLLAQARERVRGLG